MLIYWFRILCFISCATLSCSYSVTKWKGERVQPHGRSGEIYVCTAERTGTNLLLSMLSSLTHEGCVWTIDPGWNNLFAVSVDDTPLRNDFFGTHCPSAFAPFKDSGGMLFITLRDYKEVLLRWERLGWTKPQAQVIQQYYSVLELYDQWDPARRCIITYEDMILRPLKILSKMSALLGVSQSDTFVAKKRFTFLRREVWMSYKKRMKTTNGGVDPFFYQKKVSLQKRTKLTQRMRRANELLFDKYLLNYKNNY